jgi:uncharacterized protein (TIGR02453 family)
MPARKSYVTPRTFRFLSELARNNDRAWFTAHKESYNERVRDPLLAFVEAFGPRLAKISEYMVADPRPVGGSLFRVYRDTRFARDKSPYKTYAGMTFRHALGRELTAPGFYLHIEPGRCFGAAGMWHAPSDALKQVRDAIVAHPQRWKRARRELDEDGERLVRPPRGFDAEHPFIEDLKLKGFTRSVSYTQKEVCSPDFLDRFTRDCRKGAPLMEFLAEAVGVDW